MRYINWVWDFDGTLFNSYPWILQSFVKTLKSLGVDPRGLETEILVCLKQSLTLAIDRFSERFGLDPKVTLQRYHSYDDAFIVVPEDAPCETDLRGFSLYPGIGALCRAHAANGGKHFLYTHRDCRAVSALEACGLLPLFTACVTKEDAYPLKPAPDALLRLVSFHNLNPAQTVMIGDRDIDLLAGRAAGVADCLFDPDGYFVTFDTRLRAASAAELARVLT